jgi:hypothetical protein
VRILRVVTYERLAPATQQRTQEYLMVRLAEMVA